MFDALRWYRIECALTGELVGHWFASSRDAAVEAFLRDAGYGSPEQAMDVLHTSSWSELRRELRVTEVDHG